jgi:outer membrane protein assembly factor BamB
MQKRLAGVVICIMAAPLILTSLCIGAPGVSPSTSHRFSFFDAHSVLLHLSLNGTAYGEEFLWKANTTGTNYEESAVTYVDGVAYVGSCSTHGMGHDRIFAVNTTTGEIVWSRFTGPGYVGPVIDGNVVYIGTCTHGYDPTNEHLFALNRFTGVQLWNISVYGGIAESIQYDAQNLYFCTGFYAGNITAVYKNNGSIRWTYSTGYDVCPNKPMLKDNAVYAAFWSYSFDGKLFKIDATTGDEIWSQMLSAGPWDNSITADGNGHLFLGLYYGNTLNAYYESNGSLIWEYHLHGGPLSFNAYHHGVVFIADTSGYVYALNATRGSLLWETKVGNDCDISSPTLSGGLLFIGTRDGVDGAFFALNETTGTVLWRYPVGASVTAPPSIADGMMFCGTDGWFIYAFDVGIGNGDWFLHRYDSWNTAYSPTGLTTWQYVKAACFTTGDVTTCVVTNTYDHTVTNVTLRVDFNAYWYDESGNLLAEGTNDYTIGELSSGASMTFKVSPTPFPIVRILRPEQGWIYIGDRKIWPSFITVILGRSTIEAQAYSNQSNLVMVSCYLDDRLLGTLTSPPYLWLWAEQGIYQCTIKVVAVNSFGNNASAQIMVWKIQLHK